MSLTSHVPNEMEVKNSLIGFRCWKPGSDRIWPLDSVITFLFSCMTTAFFPHHLFGLWALVLHDASTVAPRPSEWHSASMENSRWERWSCRVWTPLSIVVWTLLLLLWVEEGLDIHFIQELGWESCHWEKTLQGCRANNWYFQLKNKYFHLEKSDKLVLKWRKWATNVWMQMTATKRNVLVLCGVEDQMWRLLGRVWKACLPEGDEWCFSRPLQHTRLLIWI